jgi:hypothetical protein
METKDRDRAGEIRKKIQNIKIILRRRSQAKILILKF